MAQKDDGEVGGGGGSYERFVIRVKHTAKELNDTSY